MTDAILVKGGRIIDPAQGLDAIGDVLIVDGVVVSAGTEAQAPEDCTVVDASGLVVTPGFIDLHVHLRDPGYEDKETVATGALAAVRGGFTTVCAMPNTDPPMDNAAVIRHVREAAEQAGLARVLPIGCVTGAAPARPSPTWERWPRRAPSASATTARPSPTRRSCATPSPTAR